MTFTVLPSSLLGYVVDVCPTSEWLEQVHVHLDTVVDIVRADQLIVVSNWPHYPRVNLTCIGLCALSVWPRQYRWQNECRCHHFDRPPAPLNEALRLWSISRPLLDLTTCRSDQVPNLVRLDIAVYDEVL